MYCYEDLVENIETWTRKLIDYSGLEWEDACLRFHETKRSIRTARLSQVRKPVYRSFVGKRIRFSACLGPLIDTLGDLAGDAGDKD